MIAKKEFTSILITVIVVKMLLSYPRELVLISGQAAWIQIIYASLIAAALTLAASKVYSHKCSIIELARMLGGKGLETAVGILVFLILLANFSTVARVFPETVKIVLLQRLHGNTLDIKGELYVFTYRRNCFYSIFAFAYSLLQN